MISFKIATFFDTTTRKELVEEVTLEDEEATSVIVALLQKMDYAERETWIRAHASTRS